MVPPNRLLGYLSVETDQCKPQIMPCHWFMDLFIMTGFDLRGLILAFGNFWMPGMWRDATESSNDKHFLLGCCHVIFSWAAMATKIEEKVCGGMVHLTVVTSRISTELSTDYQVV